MHHSVARSLRGAKWRTATVAAVFVLCAALVMLAPRVASAQSTGTEIFARVAPSVPVVETSLGHGTGFVLDANHVMTDAHVVGDDELVKVRFPDGATFGTAKVVARDWLVDMAIIEIAGTRQVNTTIAAPPTAVGSELYVLGYPGATQTSAQPILSRGLVSQVVVWEGAGVTYIRTDANGEPGLSGGPVLDSAGNIVGIIQFSSARGRYMIAASALDLKARAMRHLAGEDVDGISRRTVAGPASSSFDVQLGGSRPEQAFYVKAIAAGTLRVTVSASSIQSPVALEVYGPGGDYLASAFLSSTTRPGTLSGPVKAGEAYWVNIYGSGQATLNVQSSLPLVRFDDRDDARMTPGRVVGLIDNPQDIDCRPIALRVGQKLTVRVEANAFDPSVYVLSPGGATLVTDDDSAGGILDINAEATTTAHSNGNYVVCTGASRRAAHPGGYVLTVTATPPTPVPASAGAFKVTGQLNTPRTDHASVTLRDGRVLIVGGRAADGTLLSMAEIYDPKTGAVTVVGSRDTVARYNVSVALLNDGRVLVLGGRTSAGITSIASVYDPASGSWVALRPMSTPREGSEVIVLADGRALVATGVTSRPTATNAQATAALASAEIFDPMSEQFSAAGALSTPRNGLYATRLADGRVLIAGGDDGTKTLKTAEIYDPKTGSFSATGDLVEARFNHQSTLLPSGQVLITGGSTGLKELASAEIFDPAAGRFRPVAPMALAREGHQASALPDGRVLVSLGWDRVGPSRQFTIEIGATEIFDPKTGMFTVGAAMEHARVGGAAVLGDGRVVVPGGATASGAVATIETYTPGAAAASGTGAFVAPPAFSPGGLALVIFTGGSVDDLEAGARAANATGAWVQDAAGTPRLLVVGGPAFITGPFRTAFAQGLPNPTAATLTR